MMRGNLTQEILVRLSRILTYHLMLPSCFYRRPHTRVYRVDPYHSLILSPDSYFMLPSRLSTSLPVLPLSSPIPHTRPLVSWSYARSLFSFSPPAQPRVPSLSSRNRLPTSFITESSFIIGFRRPVANISYSVGRMGSERAFQLMWANNSPSKSLYPCPRIEFFLPKSEVTARNRWNWNVCRGIGSNIRSINRGYEITYEVIMKALLGLPAVLYDTHDTASLGNK
jgi:hypothetical protein